VTKAAVSALKARLSGFLARVKAGEEILITERDVPIARIVPVQAPGGDLRELLDLERQGLIRLGSGKLPKRFWKLRRARDPEGLVRKAVAEEREGGW
jgi:prevent-host-death family protein